VLQESAQHISVDESLSGYAEQRAEIDGEVIVMADAVRHDLVFEFPIELFDEDESDSAARPSHEQRGKLGVRCAVKRGVGA
jgi:hypothetical protein